MWNNGLVQIWKGVHQGCILSPCLFNLYAKYISYLLMCVCVCVCVCVSDISQAGIKIARRNINNLSYADDTTLMAENEEELRTLDEGGIGE